MTATSRMRSIASFVGAIAIAAVAGRGGFAQISGTWVQESPLASPPALNGPAMAYDAARHTIVLFGGDTGGGAYSNSTWTWDGANWTLQSPAVAPTGRYLESMAYDEARSEIVVFGGWSHQFLQDTWVWNGSTWALRSPVHSPPASAGAAMAYDETRAEIVLFASGQTWTWNGVDWTRKLPANSPASREQASMAYDPTRQNIVLFGGNGAGYLGDTWTWDGANWTQHVVAPTPSPRGYTPNLVFDDVAGKVLLFGGLDAANSNETWTWDGSAWAQLFPSSAPSARGSAAMAFDGAHGAVVLFGGFSPNGGLYSDTWTWTSAATATALTASGTGSYGGTATLQATLTAGGNPVVGKTITFSLNSVNVGSRTTDASGIATLKDVSLAGYSAGTYAAVVSASFAGDQRFLATTRSGDLAVSKGIPSIAWTPASLVYGTPVGISQRNATATFGGVPVTGSFAYNHAAGEVLNAGSYIFSATFTPADASNLDPATEFRPVVVARATQAITFGITLRPAVSLTGPMSVTRGHPVLVRLNDGRVLMAGGDGRKTAEIYDPATGTFSATGSMAVARGFATGTLLLDGKVLIAGGDTNASGAITATAELYDPATGTFSPTGSMTSPRYVHTATRLGDGTVLVAGGSPNNASDSATAETYDPATGTFTATPNMKATHSGHASVLLRDGTALVIGGGTSAVDLFDPATRTFRAVASMGLVRTYHTATTLLDGRVLVAGGYNGGELTSAQLYDPVAQTFTITGALTAARHALTATLLGSGQVMVAGGAGGAGTEVELYSNGVFTRVGALTNSRYSHRAVLLADGRVLVAGGSWGSSDLGSAEVFAPDSPSATPYTFTLPNRAVSDPDFVVNGTATSGLPVTFTPSGPCTVVNGSTVHLTGGGVCTITASQGGSGNFDPAPSAAQSFSIARGYQSITFPNPGTKTFGDPDFAVAATASSGLAVGLVPLGSCSVSGNTVHLTGAGTCKLTASQPGTADYFPAADVSQTFTIGKGTAVIDVTGYDGLYTGSPHGATGSATGVEGENLTTLLTFTGTYTNVPGGQAHWDFAGNGNYLADSGNVTVAIAPASANITVNGYSGTYDGSAHGATGTAVGVNGENLAGLLNLGPTFTDVPGGPVHWTFAGNVNYAPWMDDVSVTITKATPTISFAGLRNRISGSPDFSLGGIIAAAYEHSCALTATGALRCWGLNDRGQLGNGNTVNQPSPIDVIGMSSGIAAVAGGFQHTCVLTTAGGVRCWGRNQDGQLGNGTFADSLTPVIPHGLSSGVVAITAGAGGGGHTCALLNTGEVRCWGLNASGQAGGSAAFLNVPTAVTGLAPNIVAIAAGFNHTCGVLATGEVQCWGANNQGQLGDGNNGDVSRTPVDVIELGASVRAIAGGGNHTCALLTTGGVKCWGYNSFGQLGNGSNAPTIAPVPADVVGLASGVVEVSAGAGHTCALLATGGVRCWGLNDNGEVGDNTLVYRAAPTPVTGLSGDIQSLSAGGFHTCALRVDGATVCWGYNGHGQLGTGNTTRSLVPANVSVTSAALLANAGAGLPVTFSATGACSVSGTTVHLTGAGTCAITASQAGNNNFNPAALAQSFAVIEDNDGIEAAIDTDDGLVFGNDFSDIALGGMTRGTIAGRGVTEPPSSVRVIDIYPGGVRISAQGSSTVTVLVCPESGSERVDLDPGEVADVECVVDAIDNHVKTKVTAIETTLPANAAAIRVLDAGGHEQVPLQKGYTMFVGSPVAAGSDNPGPMLVQLLDDDGMIFGSFSLNPTESVDAEFSAGVNGDLDVHVNVISGDDISITVYDQTRTLDSGEPFTFVRDIIPPAISGVGLSTTTLWPANHKIVEVTFAYSVMDAIDPAPVCTMSVTSNEPANGTGDGDIAPDWEMIDAHRLRLRAERSGKGNGRLYTVDLVCTDSSGNRSTARSVATVPKSQGK